MCQVPEGRQIFANLTTYENLKIGAYLRNDKDGIERDLKRVYEIFPRLEERKNQIAGTLSGGEQQMLAMGRGIMSAPDLIMLDEPSLGLAPLLVNTIFDTIKEIKAMGKTMNSMNKNLYLVAKHCCAEEERVRAAARPQSGGQQQINKEGY